jgi:hypothetical protein
VSGLFVESEVAPHIAENTRPNKNGPKILFIEGSTDMTRKVSGERTDLTMSMDEGTGQA